jgi:regulator of protease activity HflC (stomatin/prohibitin superfamily)
MRKFLEFSLSFILLFVSIRAGWPWPVVFVFGFFLACALGLFSFAEGENANPSRYLVLGFFLALGLLLSWLIAQRLSLLSHITLNPFESKWLLHVLAGTEVTRLFWSILLGLLISAIVCALVLLPLAVLGASMVYGANDQYQRHEREAILSVYLGLLGFSKGTCLVSDGKAQFVKGQAKNLQMFGGPGTLVVQEGHAVILEKTGKLSRVVGRGITSLGPYERVSMVVPLRARTEHVSVKEVATKDHVLLQEFEFWVFHKVNPGSDGKVTRDGQFTYNKGVLLKDVWSTNGADWRGAVQAVSETAARDVVGRYDLDQIVPISDSFRKDFKEKLKQEINRVAEGFMGVTVIAVDIGRVGIPQAAEGLLMEKWTAEWQKFISDTRAQTKKGADRYEAEAEAATLGIMAQTFRGLLGDQLRPQDMIAIRFIEHLEKRGGAASGPSGAEFETLLQLRTMRELESLSSSESQGAERRDTS